MRKLIPLGQNLMEAAICLSIIVVAFLAMRVYMQRSLQARYKGGVDFVFSKIREGTGVTDIKTQYEPYDKPSSHTEESHQGTIIKGSPDRSIDWTSTSRTGGITLGPEAAKIEEK